jgi:hypothetical protein
MSTFRKQYRPLTDEQARLVDEIETRAEALEYSIRLGRDAGNPREIALAMTKLEESVMWAVKAIT